MKVRMAGGQFCSSQARVSARKVVAAGMGGSLRGSGLAGGDHYLPGWASGAWRVAGIAAAHAVFVADAGRSL
jgi:hypothetical protein